METYNGQINEFVDWVSGVDSFTGNNVTGGLAVSGGSIRQLLQNKIKNPFYMYEDVAQNRYRMFSSAAAYAKWSENPSDNSKLELFNFVRPSDYKLELQATDSDGFNNKFVRYGDTSSNSTRIAFSWSIYNDEGESSDSLSATYTIANTTTGASTSFTRWYNRSDANPNINIYNYLQPGENTVTIECKGTTTGARNTKSFTITLLQISLTSTFKFYDKFSANTPIQIPYVFERNNNSGTAKIYFRIDDGEGSKTAIRDVIAEGPTKVTEIQQMLASLAEGQHTLQIWAEAKYNDGNTQVNSNLLYYTFTIASSVVGSTNKFINIFKSFDTGDFPLSNLLLSATQYESSTLQWGYYTDSLQTNTAIPVTWKLLDGLDDANPLKLQTITARTEEKAADLSFVPVTYTEVGHETYLAAYFGNTLINTFPIYIVKNNKVVVTETGFYDLKMTAYGKTNESADKTEWTDETGNVTTSFTNIQWNINSGWSDNSFRTVGIDEYATINFQPFGNFDVTLGKTIEIEFESEKVVNTTDKLIVIGAANSARIEITPDTATLYDNSGNEVIHTNYKSNERIKLAFIINSIPEDAAMKTVESGLVYIVNNGILERAAVASGRSFANNGTIKIGGGESGVKVYNIRDYNYAISYTDAYNNFLYDSVSKADIADRNNILDGSGNINFDLCKNRIDTILITGNLSNILSGRTDKDSSTTDVTIERFCPSDSSKNFKIVGAQIRKHGQSTLTYPITSMKFWLNKSTTDAVPIYEQTQQADLLLGKNRYVMKSANSSDNGKPSIPSNKFVLQANYADSSGVHNGGLQRLIQETWFNAVIDGEYKLRTAPQLFATNQLVHHNNENLHETGWVEGYSNIGAKNTQWSNVTASEFPYDIRVAPDSFPCAVFYYDENGSQTRTFLGQYVFMDDKKSDFLYGERSIYSVPADPFCLTTTHKDDDTSANCVWDNKDVLHIEVVGSNVPFTSYMTHNNFTDIVEVEETDANGDPTGNVTRMYNWEQVFEMVYPDDDDIAKDDAKNGIDKFNPNSKYVRKAQPFIDFHEWVVSTRNNQAKFEAEAAQHLDLYKMAAYYIFALRFGLVDSLERNAQLKTYDGVHWHYEPWDMDIALGNKNDGGIAYNPPIDRNTKLPGSVTTYAFSGRSADDNGNVVTSNWLFDALEAWGYWANQIVPAVADALYNAGGRADRGLKYEHIIDMFDGNYASKWCELMYNASGYFKYVESGKGDPEWLGWLQGSRLTHRHWWLSNSMDYYDAKWFCGDYKNHFMYVAANVTQGTDAYINITPNKSTYITVQKDGITQATRQVDPNNILAFNMTIGSNTKNPIYFYGANFMEEIDLSDIAQGFDGVTLDGVYSETLGSPLKRLNVGIKLTENTNVNVDADYTGTLASLSCSIRGGSQVFENLQLLNVRGQVNFTDANSFIHGNDISELQEVRAMGSGLINFYSSESGNKFTTVELPDTVYTLWMNNSNWNTLSFWHTTADGSSAQFKECTGVPSTVHEISLLGTTGSTLASLQLVRSWLNNLVADNVDLSQYHLIMDKINWSDATVGQANLLTYDELTLIAQLGNQTNLKGYIVLRDTGSELTAGQLNNIKSWFGDTVFTKNSAGLVVDHKREYVQINIGGDIIVDQQGNVTIVEGNAASLNATRFSLAEDNSTDYMWSVGPVGSNDSSGRYNGLSIIQASESIDGIAYIQSTQSTIGHDYDAMIYTAVAGVPYSTQIHVVAASYPQNMFINYNTEGLVNLKTAPGFIEFPQTYASASFFVDSNEQYTGVIRNTVYTLTRRSDNASVSYATGGDDTALNEFVDPYLKIVKSTTTEGVKITVDTAIPQQTQLYTLSATTTFTSGYQVTCSATLVIQDDSNIIVPASKTTIFNPLNAAWTTQFGSAIGKNNMYRIDLMALTGTIDFSTQGANLPNLLTYINDSLFKYLPNVTGIILDGCTAITSTNQAIVDTNKSQMDFSLMPNLQILSVQNCSGLTAAIDLTMCPNITQVDASGTSINILVPSGAPLTKYEVGLPSSINLTNPTVLTPAGVVVDSYAQLDSLDLINIPNNKSFTTFGKVTQTYIIGGTITRGISASRVSGEIRNAGVSSFVSSKIQKPQSRKITINVTEGNHPQAIYIVEYAQDGSYVDGWVSYDGSRDITLSTNTSYIILSRYDIESNSFVKTNVTITDKDTGDLLFKLIA